eukprot:scaffold234662_cov66-Attheya_sp.AAC.3
MTNVGFNRTRSIYHATFDYGVTARTTTLVLGFCIWIFYLVTSCIRCGPGAFRAIGYEACLFSPACFRASSFFKSEVCEDGCSLGVGGKCGVSANVFWFLAGIIFSCAAGKQEVEIRGKEAHDNVAQDNNAKEDKAQDKTAATSKEVDS